MLALFPGPCQHGLGTRLILYTLRLYNEISGRYTKVMVEDQE